VGKLTGGRCRIGRCNYAELAGELGCASMQYCQATFEVQGSELRNATRQYCQANWELQGCNAGKELGSGRRNIDGRVVPN
jgi:hypothetical protein